MFSIDAICECEIMSVTYLGNKLHRQAVRKKTSGLRGPAVKSVG